MTDEPFDVALPELLAERGWSLRELSRRTRAECGWGGTHRTMSLLLSGEIVLSARALEAIAKVMRITPTHFPEYRLMQARRRLDPDEVGMARALRNLEAAPHLLPQRVRPSRTSRRVGSGEGSK